MVLEHSLLISGKMPHSQSPPPWNLAFHNYTSNQLVPWHLQTSVTKYNHTPISIFVAGVLERGVNKASTVILSTLQGLPNRMFSENNKLH